MPTRQHLKPSLSKCSDDEDASTQSSAESESNELDTFFENADDTPSIIIRGVHSGDECLLAYLSTIHGPLTEFLDNSLMQYACTLVMICVLDCNNEYHEDFDTAAVLVIIDAAEQDAFDIGLLKPTLSEKSNLWL